MIQIQHSAYSKAKATAAIMTVVMAAIAIILSPSCRRDYYNGDLDGLWQVMEVTGPGDIPAHVPQERIYMAFEFDVVKLHYPDHEPIYGNMHFDADGRKIMMDFPYHKSGEELDLIRQWGFGSADVVMNVDKLDSKSLIISNDESCIVCRKF